MASDSDRTPPDSPRASPPRKRTSHYRRDSTTARPSAVPTRPRTPPTPRSPPRRASSPKKRQSITSRFLGSFRSRAKKEEAALAAGAGAGAGAAAAAAKRRSYEKERERERDRDRDRDRDQRRRSKDRDDRPSPKSSPREKESRRSKDEKDNSLKRRSSSGSASSAVARVREWMDTCNADHSHHCSGWVAPSSARRKHRRHGSGSNHDASSEDDDVDGDAASQMNVGGVDEAAAAWRPAWLIDSVEKCLVRSQPGDRYVCLSYIWEKSPASPWVPSSSSASLPRGFVWPPVVTTSGNLDAFTDTLPETGIPPTVLDAMWLCRKLGIRHLWVDRFCIVQDDEEMRDEQMRNMAHIFANAYLTIVAAHGDAYSGLRSLTRSSSAAGGGLRPRSRSGAKAHDELLVASKWNKRAWTLQEGLYSRRSLFVFEDSFTWECHCDLWEGKLPARNKLGLRTVRHECPNKVPGGPALAFRHAPWPDLDEYAMLAMDYSRRRVTYVEDTERAFWGVTSVLSRVFTGGFMYGMPVMFLDAALLWRPAASIRRRTLPQSFGNFNVMPSWSWMGWHFNGLPVDLTLWRAAASDYVDDYARPAKRGLTSRRFRSPFAFRLRPLVQWSFSNRTFTVPLATNAFQFRDRRHRKSIALPDGWSRAGNSASGGFKHVSDDATVFRYPIPVPPRLLGPGDYAEELAAQPALPGPYLAFRASRAFLEVDLEGHRAPKGIAKPSLAAGSIWGRNGKWIGTLRSHDAWLGTASSNWDGEERLELVAISEATERRGSHVFEMEVFKEHADEHDVVEYVNVLWIERISGVAFRRGLGHVIKKFWDRETREEIDVLLG